MSFHGALPLHVFFDHHRSCWLLLLFAVFPWLFFLVHLLSAFLVLLDFVEHGFLL